MQQKYILVTLLVAANALGDFSISYEDIRTFDLDMLHAGWAILIPLVVVAVVIFARKLAMLFLQLSSEGLWLPAMLFMGDNLVVGLLTLLISYFSPSTLHFSSAPLLMWFWFSVGSLVVILNVCCGELPAERKARI